MRIRVACVRWLVVCFAVLPTEIGATDNGSLAELSFDSALQEALSAPRLTAASKALSDKREMDRNISTVTNNPQVAIQAGYRRETEVGGLEAQVNAQQPFSFGQYSRARKQAAHAEQKQLEAELARLRFDRTLAAGRAWLRLWGTMQVLHAAEHEVELAQKLAERTARAVHIGAMTMADKSEAESYLAEAELSLLSLEGEAFEQGLELSASLGRGGQAPLRPKGKLPSIALPDMNDAMRKTLFSQAALFPSVKETQEAVAAEAARLEELRSQKAGSMWLGAQFAREPTVPYSLVGLLGFQLPLFDRGERERANALSVLAQKQGDFAESTLAARIRVTWALHDLEHSDEIVRKLRDTALPATEQTLRLKERLLELGEATILEVLLQRRAAFSQRGRLGRAQAEHAASRFFLSQLLQHLHSEPPTAPPTYTPTHTPTVGAKP